MVKIIIKDSEGNVNSSFEAKQGEAISTQAQEAGSDIPVSCGVGACRTCVCKVESGQEFINPEAINPQVMPPESDDEIFSCIAGIADNAPEDAEIVMTAENL